MRKAKENTITIRHGRKKRMRSLTKGIKVSNLLTSGISRSSHPKLRSGQPEWWEKNQEIHNRTENPSNDGGVEDPTHVGTILMRKSM